MILYKDFFRLLAPGKVVQLARVQLYTVGAKIAKGRGYTIAHAEEEAAKKVVDLGGVFEKSYMGKTISSPIYVTVGEEEEFV